MKLKGVGTMHLTSSMIWCIFAALCWSGVAARPGDRIYPRFTNTSSVAVVPSSSTSSTSSSAISSSSSTSSTVSTSGTSSISPRILLNTTSITSSSSSTTSSLASTSRSIVILNSTMPLSMSSTTSSTSSSTTGSTSSTTSSTSPNSTGIVIVTSTVRPTTTSTVLSTISIVPPDCQQSTSVDQSGSLCVVYCSTAILFAFAENATATLTRVITVTGNNTFFPTGSSTLLSFETTLPPQPCNITVAASSTSSPPPFSSSILETLSTLGSICETGTCTSITTAPPTTKKVTATITAPAVPTTKISLITQKTNVVTSTVQITPSFPSTSIRGKTKASQTTPANKPPVSFPTTHPVTVESQTQPATSKGPGHKSQRPDSKGPHHTTPNSGGKGSFSQEQQHSLTNVNNPPVSKTADPSQKHTRGPLKSTAIVNGVPVTLSQSVVIIGSQTITPSAGSTVVTANGQVFSVNPTQIVGPGTTIELPPTTPTVGGPHTGAPTPTIINGVTATILGSSIVVIGSSTFTVGPGAVPTTEVVNGQSISIGPDGVGAAGATVTSPPKIDVTSLLTVGGTVFTEIVESGSTRAEFGGSTFTVGPGGAIITSPPSGASGTRAVTIDGIPITEIGTSVIVVDGSTFTLASMTTPTTEVVDGQTIVIGSGGIVIGSTTISPTDILPTQVVTAGGLTFSEIGSSLIVVDGTTLTIGPGATPTTEIVDGHTIVVGSGGIVIGSTTISPTDTLPTQVITADGLTISEIGSSIVVIDGTTFTVGPGATPTTEVIDGQTVSIGASGVGLATTTIAPPNPTVFTSNGITVTEFGSTLAVIGGSTFTIGPGATPTTDIYQGQTISVGPDGLGFQNNGSAATGTPVQVQTNAANATLGDFYSKRVLAVFLALLWGVWYLF